MLQSQIQFFLAIILKMFISGMNISLKDIGTSAQTNIASSLKFSYIFNHTIARMLYLMIRFGALSFIMILGILTKSITIEPIKAERMRFYFLKAILTIIVMNLTYQSYAHLRSAFSLAVAIGASEPIFAGIISAAVGLEKEYKTLFWSILIVVCGVLIKTLDTAFNMPMGAAESSSIIIIASATLLLANFLCAANHHLDKYISKDSAMTVTFYSCILINTILVIVFLIFGFSDINIEIGVIGSTEAWVKRSFILAIALSFSTLFFGSWIARRIDTDLNVVLANMSIPIEMVYSFLKDGTVPSLISFIGALCVIFGVILISYRQRIKDKHRAVSKSRLDEEWTREFENRLLYKGLNNGVNLPMFLLTYNKKNEEWRESSYRIHIHYFDYIKLEGTEENMRSIFSFKTLLEVKHTFNKNLSRLKRMIFLGQIFSICCFIIFLIKRI